MINNEKKYYYTTFVDFLRTNYGQKLAKIGLSFNLKCRNNPRCTFCNGSSFIPDSIKTQSVKEQYFNSKKHLANKYQTNSFIAYFQDETSTDLEPNEFKKQISFLFCEPDVKVLAFSTRPDSLNEEHLNILKNNCRKDQDIWIELGLQSIHNKTLKKINRNHTFEDFLITFKMLKKLNIKTGVHLIIGLPDEREEEIYSTFKEINKLHPSFVKIHHLQVVKNSYLAKNNFTKVLSLKEYIRILANCLSYLESSISIARLVSSSHLTELIMPHFRKSVPEIISLLKEEMEKQNIFQGKNLI